MKLVSSKLLASWLGFTTETIQDWARQKKIDTHFKGQRMYHSEASINAYVASVTKEGVPLTADDFRRGARLIPLAQAAEILGIKPVSLESKITRGRFAGLRFGSSWRFPTDAVWAYKARREKYATRDDVMKIFGCSTTVTLRWEREELLNGKQVRGSGLWRYYYEHNDILRLIEYCLPQERKGSAVKWMQDVTSDRHPFSPAEALEYLGVSPAELVEMTKRGELFYLSLGVDRRYSPASVKQAFLRQPALTPHDITHIIGGNSRMVSAWLEGPLACTIHDHTEFAHRYACLVNVIAPLLSPGMTPRNWLSTRPPAAPSLLTAAEAAAHYETSVANIEALAAMGKLGGLRRPDGVWMFNESRLRRTPKKLVQTYLADLS